MRKMILGAIFVLATSAVRAQQPVPTDPYTIKLTRGEIEIIGEALGNLPFNRVSPVIAGLQRQIMAEEAARAQPKEEKPKE